MGNPDTPQYKEPTDAWVDSTGNRGVDPNTARRIREHLDAPPDQASNPPGLPDDESRAAQIRADGINAARRALTDATNRVENTN